MERVTPEDVVALARRAALAGQDEEADMLYRAAAKFTRLMPATHHGLFKFGVAAGAEMARLADRTMLADFNGD